MRINDKDFYHGAVLMKIVEDDSFSALNKADDKYGHYIVNTDRRLFVKHSGLDESPWQFTFQPDELKRIRDDVAFGVKTGSSTFVCLICSQTTICCLDQEDIEQLIDLNSPNQQIISVKVPPRGSQHVSGSKGDLPYTVPHSAFPGKVLE